MLVNEPGSLISRDNIDTSCLAGVGKSYLLQRFCDDGRDPPQALDSTIGIGFNFRTIEIDDELFRLHIVRCQK